MTTQPSATRSPFSAPSSLISALFLAMVVVACTCANVAAQIRPGYRGPIPNIPGVLFSTGTGGVGWGENKSTCGPNFAGAKRFHEDRATSNQDGPFHQDDEDDRANVPQTAGVLFPRYGTEPSGSVRHTGGLTLRFAATDPPVMTGSPMGLGLVYRSDKPASAAVLENDEGIKHLQYWHLTVLDSVTTVFDEQGSQQSLADDTPKTLSWLTGSGDTHDFAFPSGGCEELVAEPVWATFTYSRFRLTQNTTTGAVTLERYRWNGEVVVYEQHSSSSSGGQVTVKWRPKYHYDPFDKKSTYHYDDSGGAGGRLDKIVDARGLTLDLDWSVAGRCTVNYRDANGAPITNLAWSYTWDSEYRIATLTRAKTTYVKPGSTGPLMNVASAIQDSRVYTFAYYSSGDGDNLLEKVSDSRKDPNPALGVILTNTYSDNWADQKVRVQSQTDEHNRTHTFSYAWNASILTTTYQWDDETGKTASAAFVVNGDGLPTKITITPGSKPRSDNGDTAEPAQLVWNYVYGSCACGMPTRIVTPTGSQVDMSYDIHGNLLSWTGKSPSGTGNVTYFWTWNGFEKANRPATHVPPAGAASLTYSYGNWRSRDDALWGHKPTYIKVETSSISVEGGPAHQIVWNMTLDAYGRASTVTDPDGRDYIYHYNSTSPGIKLVQSITRAAINGDSAQKTEFTLDDMGRLTKLSRGVSGNKTEYNYVVGPYGRPREISVLVATGGPTYTTKLDYDRYENLAVVRHSNLDENGQAPKYDDGSGSPRTWIRNEWHYVFDLLVTRYVDRRPQPDAADTNNPTSGSNPWMLKYTYEYKKNGDLKRVTQPNGATIDYETDGYGMPYRAIVDAGGLGVELGRLYFDNDLVLSASKRLLTGGVSPTFGTTQYIRNHGGLGAVFKVVDPMAAITELTYNSLGWVTNQKIRGGSSGNPVRLETSYDHDEAGRVKRFKRHLVGTSEQAVTTVKYNKRSQPLEVTDALGRKIIRQFDGYGRLTSVRDNLSGTASNTNEVALLYVQGRDFVSKSINKVFEETSDSSPPAGSRKEYHLSYTNDLLGRVTGIQNTGLNGNETALVTTYGYNSLGALSFHKAPHQTAANRHSRSVFDAQGRWVEFVKRISFLPGDRIRLTSTYKDVQTGTKKTEVIRVDGKGGQTRHEYDAASRLINVFRPGYTTGPAHRTKFEYDDGSRVKTITDGNSNVITQTFDNASRLLNRVIALGSGVSALADREFYIYDDIGRLNDQHTWWAGGSLIVSASELTRDGLGRIKEESFFYSGIDLNKPVKILSDYAIGASAVGDPTFRRNLTYSSGFKVRSVPDAIGRLKERHLTPPGAAESMLGRYRYFGGATRHREQFYAGTSNRMDVDLSFDGYQRLATLDYKLNGGSSTHVDNYEWDAGGNLLKRKYTKNDGSAGDAFDYDKYDRLKKTKLGVPASQINNSYAQITTQAKDVVWGLDPGNSRSSEIVTLSGQLPSVIFYTTESNSPRYQTITGMSPPPLYDGEGNLIWDGVNFMVYDFRNRLSEVYQCFGGAMASQSTSSSTTTSSSSSRTMIVPASKQDLQKAREEIKKKSIKGDLWGLLRDRPKEARATLKVQSGPKRKKGGPWAPAFEGELVLVALYAYDTHNRRIARQVALPFLIADQRFAYDGWREVEEMRPVTDASGTRAEAQKAFIWGRELDEMLAYYRKEGSPGSWVPYYPTQVRDESVVALLDASGSVVERVEYDPYGATTVYVGGSPQATSSVENPFLYTGKRLDPETGLYYYRNRYLHTGWGRFLTNDPIGGWADGYNLGNAYAFVGNSPSNHVDWYGLQTSNPHLPPRDLIGSNLSRGPVAGFLNARFSNGKILHIPIRTCIDCHQFQGNPFMWEQMKMANPRLEWAKFFGDIAPIPVGGGAVYGGVFFRARRVTSVVRCASTGGAARRAKFGHLWQEAPLDKMISRHAGPNATSWRTATGKTIYENPVTGRQVVVDTDGGYFRIFQPKTIGHTRP